MSLPSRRSTRSTLAGRTTTRSSRRSAPRLLGLGLAVGMGLTGVVMDAEPADAARRRRRGPDPALAALAAQDPFAAIRQCESGSNYSVAGRRYFGAYQFDKRTWRGLGLEGLPHQAPPEVQDEAARRLQAARGWQPWPACSRKAGLR